MIRPWMPFYVAEYLGDTGHLSTIEHGAYMLLIMHYWQNGGLPVEDRKLSRICRLTEEQWSDIRETIADFFDANWHHKRIDAEIAKAEQIINKRKASGLAGARARYGNDVANATEMPKQTHTPLPSQLQEQEKDKGARSAPAPSKRGTRLSADWSLSPENFSFAESKGIPPAKIAIEAQKFRDHWIAKAGKDGVKLDWDATWRTWVAKACEWQGYAPASSNIVGEVVWVTIEDARWPSLLARYRKENPGKEPATTGGNGGMGRRWPKAWVEDVLEIPHELRRTA